MQPVCTTTYELDINVAIGHVISAAVFYYSLLLNVCDFNAEEIFLLKPNERWGGKRACEGLLYWFNTLWSILSMEIFLPTCRTLKELLKVLNAVSAFTWCDGSSGWRKVLFKCRHTVCSPAFAVKLWHSDERTMTYTYNKVVILLSSGLKIILLILIFLIFDMQSRS